MCEREKENENYRAAEAFENNQSQPKEAHTSFENSGVTSVHDGVKLCKVWGARRRKGGEKSAHFPTKIGEKKEP
jgi:hypothetical protein